MGDKRERAKRGDAEGGSGRPVAARWRRRLVVGRIELCRSTDSVRWTSSERGLSWAPAGVRTEY